MALSESKRVNAAHQNKPSNGAQDAVEPVIKVEKQEQGVVVRRMSKRLKRLSEEELDIARKLSFSAALKKNGEPLEEEDDDIGGGKVEIVIRIRPPEKDKENDDECFSVTSDRKLVTYPPKTSQAYRSTGTATSFEFSRVFPAQTEQQELFEVTTKPVLEAAFAGKNGLVFAYGVTNSGKTYTITGTEENPGVLPRALQYVMEEIGRRKENEESPVTKIAVSYLEIYNDNVYDLISAPVRKRRALRIQVNDGKVQVRGMMEREIKSLKEAQELLAIGKKHKQMAETYCNMDSSRSHCIFSMYFYHQVDRQTELRSKVSIVDLAGAERGAKSGATGQRMQEASKINNSLTCLMRCFENLRWNQEHPGGPQKILPFRESKLTKMFQENLVARKQGRVVMIVAVNPSSSEFDETQRTLKYSALARELITMKPTSGRKTSTSYYDLDGRLRKRRRISAVEGEPDGEQVEVKRESFGHHMKREPRPSRPGRPPLRARTRHEPSAEAIAHTANAVNANALVALMERELEAHRQRTAQLEKENEDLRVQLSQTNAEKLQMELQIRAEIGNEMREQLQQMKSQYREMLQRQSGSEPSSASSKSSSSAKSSSALKKERALWNEERDALKEKVKQLQEQLSECEDEMKRMDERHKSELEDMLEQLKLASEKFAEDNDVVKREHASA